MRPRVAWCALVFVLVVAGEVRAAEPRYYLALGDSLAIGIQPAADGTLVPTNQGYADDLYAFYRSHMPGLRLKKLGCSGETTSTMITGFGPCSYLSGSQLSEAVAFIQTHRVVLITLDIGGDNLLACLNLSGPIDPSCVTTAAGTAANDLLVILGTLQAFAPDALIVGANYYDPFVAAWVFGPGGPAFAAASLAATNLFNGAIESVYQLFDVPIADVAATYRIGTFPANLILALTWTWMGAQPPRGPDVHPNALGYWAIASAFARAVAMP